MSIKIKEKNKVLKIFISLFVLFIFTHFAFSNIDFISSFYEIDENKSNQNSSESINTSTSAEVLSDSFTLPAPPPVEEPKTEVPVQQIPAKVSSKPKTTPKPTPPPTQPSPPLTNFLCPISTQSCIPCTAGEQYCRTMPGETTGYLGWSCQNNNPGNIRNGSADVTTDFKNKIIVNNGGTAACGIRKDSRGGSYFIFPTYEAGMLALKAYIKGINNGEHYAYVNATAPNCPETGTYTCGNCTLQQFFCKFAGSSTYAESVASKMGNGVTTNTLLSWIIVNRLDDMTNAIKQTEGFLTQ